MKIANLSRWSGAEKCEPLVGGSCSFIAQTAFEPAASEEYGAAAGWTTVDVRGDGTLAVEVGMFNKSTTRIPEAMFMQFQPADAGGGGLWCAGVCPMLKGQWLHASYVSSVHVSDRHQNKYKYVLTTIIKVTAPG